jgi:pimeloyl-ACP methyl ester carboxylesterase
MIFPVDLVHTADAAAPAAQAVVLENAGHMAHVDEPELWLAAVRDFLQEPGFL